MPGLLIPNPYFAEEGLGIWARTLKHIKEKVAERPFASRIPRAFWRAAVWKPKFAESSRRPPRIAATHWLISTQARHHPEPRPPRGALSLPRGARRRGAVLSRGRQRGAVSSSYVILNDPSFDCGSRRCADACLRRDDATGRIECLNEMHVKNNTAAKCLLPREGVATRWCGVATPAPSPRPPPSRPKMHESSLWHSLFG